MISIEAKLISDFEASTSYEWLETNGIGGYASSSVSGAHTRRYHGLLVAATRPPLGRVVLLSKLEETLVVDGVGFDLATNRYPNAVHPQGYTYIERFRLEPFPLWQYAAGGVTLERTIFMVNGENTTAVRWRIVDAGHAREIRLDVRPMLAFRDHHHLRRSSESFDESYQVGDGVISVEPVMGLPRLYLRHDARSIEHTGHWYRDFEYLAERERGFDFHEEMFQPFRLSFDLDEHRSLVISTEPRGVKDIDSLAKNEIERRAGLILQAEIDEKSVWPLVLAADQFVVKRGSGHTLIAGYHWFSDWGRDTMIALPGLTLATRRPQIARSILQEFSGYVSQGMIPNRFPDEGEEPEYNTVDATLWFFEAIRAYIEATGDFGFVRGELYEKLVDIIDWHIRGTRYRIMLDNDGLLHAGEEGVQLTWMDAKIGGRVVTPRTGKPVEVQALWYHALCVMGGIASELGDSDREAQFASMAAGAKESFFAAFWNADAQCLFDVIGPDGPDASIRPNQIFAVSLRHTMLDRYYARKVVDKVEAELLTPFGLRSLAASDPRYVPHYAGSPSERDAAYHQGTVWSWLIGPFVDAYRRTHRKGKRTDARVAAMLACLVQHLRQGAVGQVSEIFDGDPPHRPRGCAAQAWSVAEILRPKCMAAGARTNSIDKGCH